ncbi:MAG: 1,4-dihydroxy-2-naphthoate polyprenyltransferase [Gammaproteobacteria bacterium]|nr:1,4-dihydroxy-2-naphthoate polyprenyltransferase [Gammaproteobacteria bacterium]
MSRATAWLSAIRPKTLSMAVIPVVVATALAWQLHAVIDWLVFAMTLLAAVMIQIGTNLHNDASDFERGADTQQRLGPARATAQGWLSASVVKRGSLLAFVTAFAAGIYLVSVGGWPILLLGIAALVSGAAYSGGPLPLSYTSFSELFVYLFFGVAAVMGSYYLQTLELHWIAFVIGSALGMLAAAVLVVNNTRDIDADRHAGRRTLAVRFGTGFSSIEYLVLLMLPFLLPLVMSGDRFRWLPLLLLPWAVVLILRFFRQPHGVEMNSVLVQTAQLQLLFGVLVAVAFLL